MAIRIQGLLRFVAKKSGSKIFQVGNGELITKLTLDGKKLI
jgi:hypothetical protein